MMNSPFCPCGDAQCICQDICKCCEVICQCSQCSRLRQEYQCKACRHKKYLPFWKRRDYPNLDFLSNNPSQPCNPESDETIDSRFASQTSSSSRYSRTDESLIFQMDDISSSPEDSINKPSYEPRSSGFTGISQTFSNITISYPRQSRISERTMRDFSEPSQLNPNEISLTPGEAEISKIPSARDPNEIVPKSPVVDVLITSDSPDLPKCSKFASNETISQPRASLKTDNISVAISSNAYSSNSSQSDLNESQSSDLPLSLRSPNHSISASAPSKLNVPHPLQQLQSSKQQETFTTQSTSESCSTSDIPKFETLRISDSCPTYEGKSPLKFSSSIETISPDMTTGAILNKNHDLPSISTICSSLILSSMQAESMVERIAQTSDELQSPNFSKYNRRRTSSD